MAFSWKTHQQSFLDQMSDRSFWFGKDVLSEQQYSFLLHSAKEKYESGLFKAAQIGKGENKIQSTEIRRDSLFWIDDFTTEPESLVADIFQGIMELAKRELYLPAKRFECHYARYDKGDKYDKHRDRHQRWPGRLLSGVIYLNSLDEAQGGELVIFDSSGLPQKIRPQAGSMVVFDSSLEHEVSLCQSQRWSLTGWIREDLESGIRLN